MGRPKLPTEEVRIVQSMRLLPDVVQRIEELAQAEGCKPARIVERAVMAYRPDSPGKRKHK